MRVEFPQGVPDGCVKWLWMNVGPGNLKPVVGVSSIAGYQHDPFDNVDYAWFYERIVKPIHPQAFGDDPFEYVPTITVKDPQMSTMFVLRWT